MFNKLKTNSLLLLLSVIPVSAFAHAGHDHHSEWAFLVHTLWLAPLFFAAFMVFKSIKNRKTNKQ